MYLGEDQPDHAHDVHQQNHQQYLDIRLGLKGILRDSHHGQHEHSANGNNQTADPDQHREQEVHIDHTYATFPGPQSKVFIGFLYRLPRRPLGFFLLLLPALGKQIQSLARDLGNVLLVLAKLVNQFTFSSASFPPALEITPHKSYSTSKPSRSFQLVLHGRQFGWLRFPGRRYQIPSLIPVFVKIADGQRVSIQGAIQSLLFAIKYALEIFQITRAVTPNRIPGEAFNGLEPAAQG